MKKTKNVKNIILTKNEENKRSVQTIKQSNNITTMKQLPILIIATLILPTKAFFVHHRNHDLYPNQRHHRTTQGTLNSMHIPGGKMYQPISRKTISNKGIEMNNDDSDGSNNIRSSNDFLSKLLSRFQGDFDNYNQVYNDRKNGLKPKEGGGHEHFHVTLIPFDLDLGTAHSTVSASENSSTNKKAVLAAYYFDGMPNRIFRLRLYTFLVDENYKNENENNENQEQIVKMKLYTLNPSLEGKLRQRSEDSLTSWVSIIKDYLNSSNNSMENDNNDFMTELKRCDIKWSTQTDPIRHSYFETSKEEKSDEEDPLDAYHAIMINDHDIGGVLLESQMAPGLYIRIQDELSLWENELWVNDRGHNAETGTMVYGNQRGVPYKMTRVASLMPSETKTVGEFQRKIIDPSLSWTLGDQFRTNEEYIAKMGEVGGSSVSYAPKKD